MFRVGPLQIIPEESESAKDSQTSKDRTRQAAFVKAASNFADEAANTHCRLLSLLLCIIALGIPFVLFDPRSWFNALLILKRYKRADCYSERGGSI